MLSEKQKRYLKRAGILLGMFVGVCAILVTIIILSKGFWRNGLRNTVQSALNDSFPNTYKVSDFVDIKSGLSTSAAFFECRSASNSHMYAAIVKIPTICGPAPAVYLINGNDSHFACWAVDNGNISKVVDPKYSSGTITYWQNRLPEILKEAGQINE